MQVITNPITEKQTSLERQIRNKEITSSNSHSLKSTKLEEHKSEKGAAQNETSQYLKVLSRVENLLIQDKLPDAAIEGFAGAVKNQIDKMTEADRQMLMKIPEFKMLGLDDLEDIPEMIKNDIRNVDKNTILLKFLRIPEFADLMRTDNKPEPKTYTAQSTLKSTSDKNEGKLSNESVPILENPVQKSSLNVTQNINPEVNPPVTNQGS